MWDKPAARNGFPHPAGPGYDSRRAHGPPPPHQPHGPTPHSPSTGPGSASGGGEGEKTYHGEVLDTFAGRTSLLGVAYIRESRHVITKLIWLIIFLAMLGASIYQLTEVFHKYFSHPLKTEIELGFSTLDFPTVTLCNVNPVRSTMVYKDDDLEKFINGLNDIYYMQQLDDEQAEMGAGSGGSGAVDGTEGGGDGTEGGGDGTEDGTEGGRRKRSIVKRQAMEEGNATDYDEDYYYGYDWYNYEDEDYDYGPQDPETKQANQFRVLLGKIPRETREMMGHQKETMILSCSFQGRQCSAKNFTTILSPDYGNCFQFNSIAQRATPLKSRRSGMYSGLSLVLYVQTEDYLINTEELGFQVSIEPFNSLPTPRGGGLSLSPGFETSIGLTFMNISRQGNPDESNERFWKCENGEQFKKDYGVNYTVQSCLDTCMDKNIAQMCSCMRPEYYDFYPTSNRSLRSCYDNEDDVKCAATVITNTLASNISCDCSKPCREQLYNTRYSMIKWPKVESWYKYRTLVCKNQDEYLAANPDIGDDYVDYCGGLMAVTDTEDQRYTLSTSFINVNFYFESLNFETISQSEDYPLEQFGADIGGTIGLWTGFCIFTAVELLDLLVQTCLFFCKRACRNSPARPHPGPGPATQYYRNPQQYWHSAAAYPQPMHTGLPNSNALSQRPPSHSYHR